jgi:hypothetical protein
VWCNCSKPDDFGTHKEQCRIRGSINEVLWFGADLCISQELLTWYYADGGKLKKGTERTPKTIDVFWTT